MANRTDPFARSVHGTNPQVWNILYCRRAVDGVQVLDADVDIFGKETFERFGCETGFIWSAASFIIGNWNQVLSVALFHY